MQTAALRIDPLLHGIYIDSIAVTDCSMMSRNQSHPVQQARTFYERRQWASAFEAFLDARKHSPLHADDLARLIWSAALIGNNDEFLHSLERLHQVSIENDDRRLAARAAFWISFRLFGLGEPGRAAGWLARAERHIEGEGEDCAERGYLLLPQVFRHLGENENEAAAALAETAAEIGQRCNDEDLVALARNQQGRAVLRQGVQDRGLALLDEVMIAVTAGDLSPLVTGIVYCNVIATCQQVYALDRAREWTAALKRWCDGQPQLVTFTGNCLVHRSEIMQLGGDWHDALEEIRPACDETKKDPDVYADACYQQAELYRLQGKFDEAEAAYRNAHQAGRDPQPGLALLRLAQGRLIEAVNTIERVLVTTTSTWQRAKQLPACVEIMLAAGKLDKARAAAVELDTIAKRFGTQILGAIAAQAEGALRLAEDDASNAIEPLRRAFDTWLQVGAPYLAARIRVLLASAYRALGDNDGAALERDAARKIFEALGAAPDLVALPDDNIATHGLSSRELQVLRLVASGKTNKSIAAELCLSERTIDRHVSNILTKLDVATRAAATAFAYENGLI